MVKGGSEKADLSTQDSGAEVSHPSSAMEEDDGIGAEQKQSVGRWWSRVKQRVKEGPLKSDRKTSELIGNEFMADEAAVRASKERVEAFVAGLNLYRRSFTLAATGKVIKSGGGGGSGGDGSRLRALGREAADLAAVLPEGSKLAAELEFLERLCTDGGEYEARLRKELDEEVAGPIREWQEGPMAELKRQRKALTLARLEMDGRKGREAEKRRFERLAARVKALMERVPDEIDRLRPAFAAFRRIQAAHHQRSAILFQTKPPTLAAK